jgi:DNA-binding CsgD family transcriptional regulator
VDESVELQPDDELDRRITAELRRLVQSLVRDERFAQRYHDTAEHTIARDVEPGYDFALVVVPRELGRALTAGEEDVARLVGFSLGNKGIGRKLSKSAETVKKQLRSVCIKWKVETRAAVARRAALVLGVAEARAPRSATATREGGKLGAPNRSTGASAHATPEHCASVRTTVRGDDSPRRRLSRRRREHTV